MHQTGALRTRQRRPATGAGRRAGFTLIEVMIALAIVVIVLALAYPRYHDYVVRSRLVEATASLSATRVRLEQFYQDNRHYGSTATQCGVPMPAGQYFSYSCRWAAGGTSQSFLLTATGRAGAGMDGYVFTVDHENRQRTTAFADMPGLPVDCWLRRRGDTC